MQPSIWTGIYSTRPVEEALRTLHGIGWRCVEIATEHLRELRQAASAERVAAVRALLDELGMSAPQAHAHLSANFAGEDLEKREADLATALEELPICAALGVETVVLHPGWSPDAGRAVSLQRSAEAFSRLVERASELGLRIAVENMMCEPDQPGERRFGTSIEDLFDLIEEARPLSPGPPGARNEPGSESPAICHDRRSLVVGSPLLGICFDTSHAHVEGLDFPAAVRLSAPRLWALHISDNDGLRDLHLHPFYGTIDWAPFLSALREVGFAGPFVLEIGGFSRVTSPAVQDAKCRHALALATLMTSGAASS